MTKRLFQKESYYGLKVLGDGILLAAAFFVVYFLRRGEFYQGKFLHLEPKFAKFFPVLMMVWLLVTLLSKKFTQLEKTDYFSLFKPYIFSVFAQAALLNAAVYILGWYDLSRAIVFGTLGLFFLFELVGLSIRYVFFPPKPGQKRSNWVPVVFFLVEFFLLAFSFTAIYYYKRREFAPPDEYLLFLMGVIFLWIVVSMIVHRFEIRTGANYYRTLFPFLKSQLILIGLVSITIFSARLVFFSRTIILGTLLSFALLENLAVTIYYLVTGGMESDEARPALFRAPILEKEHLEIDKICEEIDKEKYVYPGPAGLGVQNYFFKEKLEHLYLKKFEAVFEFIDRRVDLEKLDILNSILIYNRNHSNIEIFEDNALQFFVNLRQVNDIRRINKYLVKLNEKMKTGGIFASKFESLSQTRNRLYTKYPFALARAVYPFFFLYKRVFPKLPILRKIYFILTEGRRRVISEAEILGRLYFCGFEIIDLKEIDNFTWFIAKKVKEPVRDRHPSYGFFFKQKRVGKNGKPIYTYKIRTMHPYSEYIHKFILEHFELDESGKIKSDFRITPWGKVFRKLLIDEIPMLVNWIKRDIKLVGVRPLSQSFFDTYPEDLKKERIKFKPGLVPPYYADMPNSMEEVWESEKKYLEKYKKHPVRTDIAYFFKAMKNILFHHAKSG